MLGASTGYANPSPGGQPGTWAVGTALALPLTGGFREGEDADTAGLEVSALEADATVEQLAVKTAEIYGSISGLEAALPAAIRSRPRQQLEDRERLDEVVVGARLESRHSVTDLTASGEEKDRDLRFARAQAGAEIDTGSVREHDVEDHHVEGAFREDGCRLLARGRRFHAV